MLDLGKVWYKMKSENGSSEFKVAVPEHFQVRTSWGQSFFEYLTQAFQNHSYSEMILQILQDVALKESETEMIWGVESIELSPWRVQIRFIAKNGGQKSSRVITFGTDVVCLLLSHNGRYALVRQSRFLQKSSLELPRCMTKHGESLQGAVERLIVTEIGLPWEAIGGLTRLGTLGSGIAPYVRPHVIFKAEFVGEHIPNPKKRLQN